MDTGWYSAWRDEAFDQLDAKNMRLENDFRLGHWARYDYDLTDGKLRFSEDGVIKVVADIQIAGTTSAKAGNWRWGWADSNVPTQIISDAKLARSFGELSGLDELTQAFVTDTDDVEALGWGLTAVMVRICDALGAYRCPRSEGGGLYLTIKTIDWAS
ncbi:hypothetical protein CN311_14960 [Mesorhizobium sanjuanii]|uniref:Uncharacterized protein n=1 Tax=Mesorhizobium sanjuanii TaxID=2037900 RepID=A0A2A6FE85_9HYPH|nr:DUF6882 domain-containing protein [Mesorhizobium sanjuanii]PDQ20290.1 hypothetical protein CN311_14960 [Mesorhizobium sanjuanii]